MARVWYGRRRADHAATIGGHNAALYSGTSCLSYTLSPPCTYLGVPHPLISLPPTHTHLSLPHSRRIHFDHHGAAAGSRSGLLTVPLQVPHLQYI